MLAFEEIRQVDSAQLQVTDSSALQAVDPHEEHTDVQHHARCTGRARR